jgi:hypothetical protein
MMADNDLALGRIVATISNSPYWKDTVVFVIEDDAQNGVDHVDGHRTVGFVLSAYTRKGATHSRYHTQLDFLRAMESFLGLAPLNQLDSAVDPASLADVFTDAPDHPPFTARPNGIPLDEMNPPASALGPAPRAWAAACAAEDFSKPDAADSRIVNRAIWFAQKGYGVPYPADGRVLLPSDLKAVPKESDD